MEYVAICAWGEIFSSAATIRSAPCSGATGTQSVPCILWGWPVWSISCWIFFSSSTWAWGQGGTALATVLSQGVSMAIGIGYLKRKRFLFDFKPASFRIDPAMAKELARVGIPISFQELMVRISFLYLTAVMNHCGVYAAAVVGIGSKYDVFSMLSATSIANALAAITAQNMGAGKPERARKSLWYGLSFALLAACAFWTWAQVSPETMIALFSEDSGVIAAGVPFFRACSYDYIMVAFVFCLNRLPERTGQDPLDHGQLHLRRTVSADSLGLVCERPFFPGPGYAGDRGACGVGDYGTVYSALYTLGGEAGWQKKIESSFPSVRWQRCSGSA